MCVVVSGAKFSVEKSSSAVRELVFSPSTGLLERKHKLQKHWNYGEQHSPDLLSLLIEKEVPRKIETNRIPPFSHLNSVTRIKALLVQGLVHSN